jgi:hypothetical protein
MIFCLAPGLFCAAGGISEKSGLRETAEQKEESRCFALLVGCTRYDHLPQQYQLRGPANDIVLMKDLLTSRFALPEKRIRVLSEAETANARPTRDNIEKEFRRMAENVHPGDQAVIVMGGHGSQQPDDDPQNPDDPEPDGLDELFLPADIRGWEQAQQRVSGAIVDDELRRWLAAIRDRGAFVWITLDSCHSGTIIRSDAEVPRQIAPEDLGIPKNDLAAAAKHARAPGENTRGAGLPDAYDLAEQRAGIVALYAARASEPTIEKSLPPGDTDAKPYGLLTFTMAGILSRSQSPITYRELSQAVQQQYLRWGRSFPTPLLEGTEIDRQVLGIRSWPGRSRILLSRDARRRMNINAGLLHGMTKGSVLAVYPSSGGGDRPLGHVRVEETRPVNSLVAPIAFDGAPAAPENGLPETARCNVVYRHFGDARLRLAIDPLSSQKGPPPANWRKTARTAIEELEKRQGSFVALVDDLPNARWVLRATADQVSLVPASGLAAKTPRKAGTPAGPALYGPGPSDPGLNDWLSKSVQRIARVENLLSLASPLAGDSFSNSEVRLTIEPLRFRDSKTRKGEVVDWGSGRTLNAGDIVGFRVKNQSRFAVDVTLLFVDSDYGISAFFPEFPGAGANRVPPGRELLSPRAEVTKSNGAEHIVVIAVKAEKTSLDFTCLAQSGLENARALDGGGRALDSPLGQLLQSSLFGAGGRRGLRSVATANYSIRLISWGVRDE